MTIDIVDELRNPESYWPGNFNTRERANAYYSALCQQASEEIERLRLAIAGFEQTVTDPENQPSQYGTVTLDYMESDPAYEFCHRLAITMACMLLADHKDKYWDEAAMLLDAYRNAIRRQHEKLGEPYVSGFGKD